MTLNLMLTSKDAVYLSGDFRLTSIRDLAPIPDSYDTQKLIPVIRHAWTALIAYMGVASAPPLIDNMGQWIVDSIYQRDYNVILAVELFSTILVLVGLLLTDLSYALVDPRIRYE